MFITYSIFYPSHKYFVFIIMCQSYIMGLLYGAEQNLVPHLKGLHRLMKETQENDISMDGCRASQEGKHFKFKYLISSKAMKQQEEYCITNNSTSFALSSNLNTPFHSTSTHLSSKTMATISNIHVQASGVIPDPGSMSQKCNHQMHSFLPSPWLRLSPCHSEGTFALHISSFIQILSNLQPRVSTIVSPCHAFCCYSGLPHCFLNPYALMRIYIHFYL